MARRLRVAPLYGTFALWVAASCFPPTDTMVEVQPTKVLFKALNSVPSGRMTQAEMTEPLYPVSIPSFPSPIDGYDTMFIATFKGWMRPFGPSDPDRQPGHGRLKFFGGLDENLAFPTQSIDGQFAFDAIDPLKLVWQPTSSYPAGHDHGFTSKPDQALVEVDFSGFGVSTLTGLGMALLPWKLASEASTINGSAAVAVNQQVWIQAVATGLAQPVAYDWSLDGTPLWGVSGTFYSTEFSTAGTRSFSVKMTGSDGQYVIRDFTVTVAGENGCIVCGDG